MKTAIIIFGVCVALFFVFTAILMVWHYLEDFLLWDIPCIPNWIWAIYAFAVGVTVSMIGIVAFVIIVRKLQY